MQIDFREVGRGFDELIAQTTRDVKRANKALGKKIEKAGKAAVAKGAPRMWGKKLTVKAKIGSATAGHVQVYFSGFSAGGWAIQEWGTKPHEINPVNKRALFFNELLSAHVGHPGTRGHAAWTAAKARLRAAIEPVIRDAYDEALAA